MWLGVLQALMLALGLWVGHRQFVQGRRYQLLKLGNELMVLRQTHQDDYMLAQAVLHTVERHIKELS